MSKTGRNDPCPCGSGKKYKKCCLSKSYTSIGPEESIRTRVIEDLLAFSKRYYRDSIGEPHEYFWGDFDPEVQLDSQLLNMADINFWEWYLFDWIPDEDNEMTLVELYLKKTRGLRPGDKDMLAKMNDAVLSLYEVQEIFPEKGILLKDLLLGKEYDVREKLATRSLRKWDLFAARLLYVDGNYIMTGSAYPFPMRAKQSIIGHLKKCLKDYRKHHPDSNMHNFLKRNGDLFNYYWCEEIRAPFKPTLMTTSGEPMLFSDSLFGINDREATLERLRNMNAVEETENGAFEWLGKQTEDGSATVFGTIRISNGSLKLECISKERLERGKALILDSLGDLVTHKVDTIQDPYQALKDNPQVLSKNENEIPKDIQQEVCTRFMQKHYESWLNEKIPALDGKTPLEMVKKPWGKKKVTELLKSIENIEEHKKQCGEPYFDTAWLWEELGLER